MRHRHEVPLNGRLRRTPVSHLLRADEFDAQRALALGFVQEVVPTGDRSTGPWSLRRGSASAPRSPFREIKRAAQVYLEEGEQAAYREIPAMRARTANSADFAEGIASFVERGNAKFQGR